MKNRFFRSARVWMTCLAAATMFAASARAADAPDTSTPKKAAVSFMTALMAGDVATAKTMSVGTDVEFGMVKMLCDVMVAAKNLENATVEKFGDQGKLPRGMLMDVISDLESSDEKIDGDHATLISKTSPDQKFPPILKKVDGAWKMDLSTVDKDPSLADMPQMVPKMLKAFAAVTANVKAGQYKSMEEVFAALHAQLQGNQDSAPAPAPQQ